MELNQLAFTPRSRSPYEVFDLTTLLTKQHFLKLFSLFSVLVLPVFLVFSLAIDWMVGAFIVWWLKPLFERALLDYLAKVVFNQEAKISQSIKALLNLKWGNMLLNLTLFRLSPNRALLAPIDQLEQLEGARKEKRKNLMFASSKPKQALWIVFCVHFEFILLIGITALTISLVPQSIELVDGFSPEVFYAPWIEVAYAFVYVLCMCLVAPLFVCGGFLAYLHRRIELEGWDIELSFKNIRNRIAQTASSAVSSFIALLFVGSVTVTPAYATSVDLAQSKQTIDAIYSEEGVIKTQETWAPKKINEADALDFDLSFLEGFLKALGLMGSGIAYLFWALVIALGLWLIYLLYQKRGFFTANPIKLTPQVDPVIPTLFTHIDEKVLPNDLLLAAKNAYLSGDLRLALAYLLHHSLVWVQSHHEVKLHKSMTEGECKRAIFPVLSTQNQAVVEQLFNAWMTVAWAHKKPNLNFDHLLNQVSLFESANVENKHEG